MSTVLATSVRRSMWPLNNNQKEPLPHPPPPYVPRFAKAGKIMLFSSRFMTLPAGGAFQPRLLPLPASQRGDSIKYLPDEQAA